MVNKYVVYVILVTIPIALSIFLWKKFNEQIFVNCLWISNFVFSILFKNWSLCIISLIILILIQFIWMYKNKNGF